MPQPINTDAVRAPAEVTSPGGTVQTNLAPFPGYPDITKEQVEGFKKLNPGVTDEAALGSILNQRTAISKGEAPAIAAASAGLENYRDVMTGDQRRSLDAYNRINTLAQTRPEILNEPDTLRSLVAGDGLERTLGERPELGLVPGDMQEEDRSAVGMYMTNLYREYQRLTNPETERKSFVNTYQEMLKAAGPDGKSLSDVDTRLFDIEKIIRGTKDDIKNELKAAGGLVTDSAVAYLAGVRNKVLLEESDRLERLKTEKEKYIDRMLELGKMDREEADKRFERAFDLQGKAAELEVKLEESGFKREQEYQQMLEKQQDNARQRVQMLISSKGLRNFTDAQLGALEADAGFVEGDLIGVRDALLEERADDIERLNLATERLNLAIERANNSGSGSSSQNVKELNAQISNYAAMKSSGQQIPAWAEKYIVEKKKLDDYTGKLVGTGEYQPLEVTKGMLGQVDTDIEEGNRATLEAEMKSELEQQVSSIYGVIQSLRKKGTGWTEIRAAAQADGVPPNVYQLAVRRVLEQG